MTRALRSRAARTWGSVLVSVVAVVSVVLWARHQDAPRLPSDPGAIAELVGAVALYAVATLLRGWRWHLILTRLGAGHRAVDACALTTVGYMGNTVLPARGGEVLRTVLLAGRSDVGKGEALGSVIAERALDAISLAVLFVALTWAGIAGTPLGQRPALAAAIGLVVLLAAAWGVVQARRRGRLRRVADRLRPILRASRPLLSPWGAGLLVVSLVVWLIEGGIFWLVAQCLSLPVTPVDLPVRQRARVRLGPDPRGAGLRRNLRRRRDLRAQDPPGRRRPGRRLRHPGALRAVRADHGRRPGVPAHPLQRGRPLPAPARGATVGAAAPAARARDAGRLTRVIRGRTGLAVVTDRLLDWAVLGFAAWTVIYHVCLIARVPAVWAELAEVLAAVGCAWFVAREPGREPDVAEDPGPAAPAWAARRPIAVAAALAAATAAAVVFGLTDDVWAPVWILWIIAALAALLVTLPASAGEPAAEPAAGHGGVTALAWALGLAVLSLFVVNNDSDDAQYVHVAGWVQVHGVFPVRDTLFTHETLPSLFYPPVSSFEALLGTFDRGLPVSVPTLVYLGVTPVATALAVLALWRLLRAWAVARVGLALSVALVFLLFDAGEHWLPGSYFIGRMWQGKVIFVAVLIPILLVALQRYAQRGRRRELLMLGAAGAAATGLSTTAIFTVPVLAAACLAPLAMRLPWRALAGLAATAAYPLGAGVVTLVLGGRNPDEYTDAELAPAFLAHRALGTGWYGAIALFAVLAAAVAIPRRPAARMLAATVLVVGLLYTQGVPELIFHATGLGRVLWRMLWLIPVAAALGALAVRWSPRRAAIGALPAVAVCVLIAIVGAPIWSSAAFGRLDGHPALKLNAGDEAAARAILRRVPRGAHVLAPQSTSQALLVLSGTVTVVNPLSRYTKSLDQFGPRARATARVTLGNFAETGVNSLRHAKPDRFVLKALRRLYVRTACLRPGLGPSDALLARAGWKRMRGVPVLDCRRAPPGG